MILDISGLTLTGTTVAAVKIAASGYMSVNLDQMEISDNFGAAIICNSVGGLTVTNSTIANNGRNASSSAAAVYVYGKFGFLC